MLSPSIIFSLVFVLKGFMILEAYAVNIQVFKHENFTGLVWKSNSSTGCNNVPDEKIIEIQSISTDTCFIVYWESNCKSFWSVKYMPGRIKLSSNELGRHGYISSFHICNQKEGSNELNVDIMTFYQYNWSPPVVLERYKNVCSCVNVPQYVQNMFYWSIDNHHNDLMAYYGSDCSVKEWHPELILGGNHDSSRNMYNYKKIDFVDNVTIRIRSFGPVTYSTYYYQVSCMSYILATGNPKTNQSETQSRIDKNIDLNNEKGIRVLNNKIVELEKQVDRLRRKQDNFRYQLGNILKLHNDNSNKLTERVVKLQQECRNFTEKIKSDFYKVFA